MIIIAIGWMYVVLLMALTQPTWLAGIFTVIGYGLFPLSIVLYLVGTPGRRRRAAVRKAAKQPDLSKPEHEKLNDEHSAKPIDQPSVQPGKLD